MSFLQQITTLYTEIISLLASCQSHIYTLSTMPYIFVGEGNGNPLQYACLENPMDRGAW